jgi:hypothetical protein
VTVADFDKPDIMIELVNSTSQDSTLFKLLNRCLNIKKNTFRISVKSTFQMSISNDISFDFNTKRKSNYDFSSISGRN